MNEESPNILIVDDNVLNLQVTTEILQDKGYRIGLAQSGQDALKQIEVQLPDLILLDIMMPNMDGIEVCKRIRANKNWCDIPIIFLTARTQTEDIVKAFEVGGADYVTKPFQKEELLARVKNQVELYRSKLKIKSLNSTRDRLYSIIAHDIRTPFSNIIFIISAIKDKLVIPGTKDFDEIIEQLDKSTNNTHDLLINLLSWAQYQSGVIHPEFDSTDLNSLILEANQLLQPIAENKNIKTEFYLDDDCMIHVDPTTVKTIIRNLYSNAIKFSEKGEVIIISTHKNNGYSTLKIQDTGIGMDKHTINRLFNKKEAFTTEGTNNESGTGLGLQIVRDFVDINNANLEVISNPGVGTLFSITFNNKPKP